MGRLTNTGHAIMQTAFSRSTSEDFGTHLWFATLSLWSPRSRLYAVLVWDLGKCAQAVHGRRANNIQGPLWRQLNQACLFAVRLLWRQVHTCSCELAMFQVSAVIGWFICIVLGMRTFRLLVAHQVRDHCHLPDRLDNERMIRPWGHLLSTPFHC